jgi:rubredoxin
MKCGYCGLEFDESQGVKGCGSCPGGCHSLHCPRCNYKNPLEPVILKKLKKILNKGADK